MAIMVWMWGGLAGCGTPAAGPEAEAPAAAVVDEGPIASLGPNALSQEMFGEAPRTRLYNVWATWCPPCREEMPLLKAWAAAHPEVEVVLVNVDLLRLQKRKVLPFLEQQGLLHLRNVQLDDPDPAFAMQRVIPGFPGSLPVTVVVGPDGTIRKRFDRVLTTEDLAALP